LLFIKLDILMESLKPKLFYVFSIHYDALPRLYRELLYLLFEPGSRHLTQEEDDRFVYLSSLANLILPICYFRAGNMWKSLVTMSGLYEWWSTTSHPNSAVSDFVLLAAQWRVLTFGYSRQLFFWRLLFIIIYWFKINLIKCIKII